MFGSNIKYRKKFSFTTLKSIKRDDSVPLKKRMKFSSLSSFEAKERSKKKLIFFLIMLFVVTAFIGFYGFRSMGISEVIIDENMIERVDGK